MKKFYSLTLLWALLCCSLYSHAQVEGCTDMSASNYDASATDEDGSCLYLCDEDPANLLDVSTAFGFNSDGDAFGLPNAMGLLAGALNDFGGFAWSVNTAGLTTSDFAINIDFNVTGDPADFPRVLEFRIVNDGVGSLTAFNMEVPGPGSYTLGGLVSTGAPGAGGFDPDGASPIIVAALAHFPANGVGLVDDIIVEFSNLCVSTSVGTGGCTDESASNYNELATEEDGSCLYLCSEDPANLLDVSTAFGFNSDGDAFGVPNAMGLLAGALNDFGGFAWSVNTAGLNNSEFAINLDCHVTGNPADFPRVLEFRIVNDGVGSLNAFNMEVPGPGIYTLGGIVASGDPGAGGFDPDGASPIIVAAIAHFPADPIAITEDIIVEFSNLCVTTNLGSETGCTNAMANNYNPSAVVDDGSCLYNFTFNVDMNCYDGSDLNIDHDGAGGPSNGSFTTPAVEGPYFGWCGSCVPMSDPDGDNIWSVTVEVPGGSFEYKYAHDFFAGQEQLVDDVQDGNGECVGNTDGANFANRVVEIPAVLQANDVYGSCGPCGSEPEPVAYCGEVVKHLGIESETPSAIFLTIENSGPNSMTVTIESANADPVDAIVLNAFDGPITGSPGLSAPDMSVPGQISQTMTWAGTPPPIVEMNVLWSKESFEGNWQLGLENTFVEFNNSCSNSVLGCTDYNAYNFNEFANEDDGSCVYEVTFKLNMIEYPDEFGIPEVNGEWNDWCGGCQQLFDDDGDLVYEGTHLVPAGTWQYKFAVDGWSAQENLTPGSSCTVTDESGVFTNRVFTVGGDFCEGPFCWNECDDCSTIGCFPYNFPDAPVNLQVSFSTNVTFLNWSEIPGSLGCQVQGNYVGAPFFPKFFVYGDAPDEYPVNNLHLIPGTEYQWRVRCGCQLNPLVATPWSEWNYFTHNEFPIANNIEINSTTIYPNPNNGEFNLSIESSGEGQVQVRVYDILGSVVYDSNLSIEFDTQYFNIALENVNKGIYFVDIATSTNKITKKVVIE